MTTTAGGESVAMGCFLFSFFDTGRLAFFFFSFFFFFFSFTDDTLFA